MSCVSCMVCRMSWSYVCREVSRRSLFSSSVQRSWKPVEEPARQVRPVRGAALRHLPLLPKHSLSPSTFVVGTAITTCTASHGQHLIFHQRTFSQSTTTIQQFPHNAVRHFAGLGHAQPASVQIHPTGSQRGASMDRRHSRPLITAWRPVGRSQRWNRAVRAG